MKVSEDIFCVSTEDNRNQLFEGQFSVPDGMLYNSYLIIDEKCAVLDTADEFFCSEWLGQVKNQLGEKRPDFLVVHHAECDHSGSIGLFLKEYPEAKIVASAKCISILEQFLGFSLSEKSIAVKEGDVLNLGKRELSFIAAPMIHWPEVMFSFEKESGILFSADAFGKFGRNKTEDSEWTEEARRYYFGIVGKFGMPVQNVLKKVSSLGVKIICPLHGPILSGNIPDYVSLYAKWSSYKAEKEGVLVAYASIYGHTKIAAEMLASMLKEKGTECFLADLCGERSIAVAKAFEYSKLVIASVTYNGGIFPAAEDFIRDLVGRGFCGRKIGLVQNGSWGPLAAKAMKEKLSACKDVSFAEQVVTIKGSLNEQSKKELELLASEILG